MMNITFNLEEANFQHIQFANKQEWDEYLIQFRPNRGYYNPQPRDTSPNSFPCLMVYSSDVIYNPGMNDEFFNFFLYDYQFIN